MVWLLVASLAVGCGRLDFDLVPDAPSGHDEDGDGIADDRDPCPHVAGDLTDTDDDNVGDACDPNPSTPSESYVLFATLTPGDHPFVTIADWTQQADALQFVGDTTTLYIAGPVVNARIEIGFEIRALFGTGQHQVASGIERPIEPYYFVELNENAMVSNVAIVSYDPVNGYLHLGEVLHSGMHPGRGLLQYEVMASAPRQFTLHTGWTGELYDVTALTPAYDGGQEIRFVFNGLDIALLYAVVIAIR